MQQKESTYKICIWIHHLATFIGLFTGVYHLRKEQMPGTRYSNVKRCLLFLFSAVQSWAAVKILSDSVDGETRFQQSFEEIHQLSGNGKQERSFWRMLTALSVLFKTGIPWLLVS